ncbi:MULTISPECIES: ribonuclease Z [Nocardiopsis]|uniref:Ribonuclease Z n=1 Tax=Nocardiopsis dassonvillei (strain ATCC 23218 / DSM 43111 / CIP 107115 / JCM 7437 / KCTC 9190 / NBRC 14626 / NCTC 10488 / NRRL B-5397 / IMRU 509) TaxID=446468 RepID=D7B6F2_NOCDD|nr:MULTISPECIES: ribonuclease Z [Nocardiopsis]ADH67417.1 ribonuclease Z [Nocardiopsis dassonvillei subsp. dassonvillei DSM 43111]NKY77420.1 ribonuclease Z [Nocardiopsis dassonvillei]VEI87589.1 Ribonuclease BN [Nocardiopsis dassonvillei]
MSVRELVVLGTSSAVPTRRRNHNGYFLRWDTHGVLFDPGEGTQRQMRLAGLAATDITRICVTHFHGDHCLGLPGTIQRIARDRVPHTVRVAYPADGQSYWRRLRHATAFHDTDVVLPQPVGGTGSCLLGESDLRVTALPLRHSTTAYGYRLAEPDGWRMLPERLAAHGVRGPMVGELQRRGSVTTAQGRRVELADCARPRRGQVMAFVMDTAECEEAVELARGADMLVIESTYLDTEEHLARAYGHLTARQAGRVAARAGARTLVLTHISERYEDRDDARFLAEAAAEFDGPLTLAQDLQRLPVPPRDS